MQSFHFLLSFQIQINYPIGQLLITHVFYFFGEESNKLLLFSSFFVIVAILTSFIRLVNLRLNCFLAARLDRI